MQMDKNMMILAGGAVLLVVGIALMIMKSRVKDDDKKKAMYGKIAYASLAIGAVVAGFGAYQKYGGSAKSIASAIASPSFDF